VKFQHIDAQLDSSDAGAVDVGLPNILVEWLFHMDLMQG